MKYFEVQRSLEKFVQANWSHTSVAYENVPFSQNLYTEYVRCDVLFGDSAVRGLNEPAYRSVGILVLGCFVKPDIGVVRITQLAGYAATMIVRKIVQDAGAPDVYLLDPEMIKKPKEHEGWVMAQVRCPFYYDLEL